MNIKQMQREFGIQMNQFSTALALTSDDIEYWLNKGQEELVKTKYNGLNQKRKGFEQSQQLVDDLRMLIESNHEIDTNYIFSSNPAPTGFYIDSATLPENYMFLLAQKSKVSYNVPVINWEVETREDETQHRKSDKCFRRIFGNRFAQTDTIYNLLKDPFNTTKVDSPLTVIHGDRIDVYTNKTFIVEQLIIDYLRVPRLMSIKEDISSELPVHLHKEIIERAVDLFLNNTRELKQRLQRETPVANNTQNIEEENV